MTAITTSMIDAIKVQFLKPIFEDDFPERGMKAWLTRIEWKDSVGCYNLHFDFTEFEKENEKYFAEEYYPNRKTAELGLDKQYYTAIEAGMYNPKCSVYFAIPGDVRNDAVFAEAIKEYLATI